MDYIINIIENEYPRITENKTRVIAMISPKNTKSYSFNTNLQSLNEYKNKLIIHPRYVINDNDSFYDDTISIIEGNFLCREKSIDLFFNYSFKINEEKYPILNFKGVGSDADRELVINQKNWYDNEKKIWLKNNPKDNQIWGSIEKNDAFNEYTSQFLEDCGIKIIPYLSVNKIPKNIVDRINQVEKTKGKKELYQIVRALKTNITISEKYLLDNLKEKDLKKIKKISIDDLTDFDASFINTELNLIKKGALLGFNGFLKNNRLIDGFFMDKNKFYLEYGINNNRLQKTALLIQELITETSYPLIRFNKYGEYLKKLEDKTGIPFKKLLKSENNMYKLIYSKLEENFRKYK